MIALSSLSVGQALPVREFPVTRADLVAYASASGDQNPIHQDEAVALSVGLPGVIAHGMFTMGLGARVVTDLVGADAVVEYGVRFTRPVVVGPEGAVVTVTGTVASIDEDARTATLDLVVTCEGQTVLGRPRAVVRCS